MRRDRLEVLTALVNGTEFDPVLRGGVLKIPPTHPVYPWSCCTAAPAPGVSTATTATSSSSPAPTSSTGGASGNSVC
jgi:hypothetical protein